MDINDKQEFAKMMYALQANFGGDLTKEKLALYFDCLKPYSIDEIKDSIVHLIHTRTTGGFPRLAEILRTTYRIKGKVSEIEREIMDAIQQYGQYLPAGFKWSNPIINFLLTGTSSYHTLCNMTSTQLEWWLKGFREQCEVRLKNDQNFIGISSSSATNLLDMKGV